METIMGRFIEVCRKRVLKVNTEKKKVMVLNEDECLECEVRASEFKCLE